MSIERTSAGALDYLPCRYGNSRLLFRGPRRSFDRPYILFLGGSETYGKYVSQPFPGLVETAVGQDCVNLGCINAGIDSFVHDPDVLQRAGEATVTVLQVLGAHNLSNRFYRVHPRRNDRFLSASPLLQAVYRDVDFTDFSFNKHMLGTLHKVSPDRFETVRSELRQAWMGRMKLLLSSIKSGVVLLWLRGQQHKSAFMSDPCFVDAGMIDALRDQVVGVIDIEMEAIGTPEDMEGMVFDQMDVSAAMQSPGPQSHGLIARRVIETLATGI